MIRYLPLFLSLGLLPAWSQPLATGSLSVQVVDNAGSALPGASVTATSPSVLGPPRAAVADDDGVATLDGLPPASDFTVTIELNGFDSGERRQVAISAGRTAQLNVELMLASVQGEIIVTSVQDAASNRPGSHEQPGVTPGSIIVAFTRNGGPETLVQVDRPELPGRGRSAGLAFDRIGPAVEVDALGLV